MLVGYCATRNCLENPDAGLRHGPDNRSRRYRPGAAPSPPIGQSLTAS
jgi:hypothetical protein